MSLLIKIKGANCLLIVIIINIMIFDWASNYFVLSASLSGVKLKTPD